MKYRVLYTVQYEAFIEVDADELDGQDVEEFAGSEIDIPEGGEHQSTYVSQSLEIDSVKPAEDGPLMQIRFFDIDWDMDDEEDDVPTEVHMHLKADTDVESDGADILSDKFGWCVNGFSWEKVG